MVDVKDLGRPRRALAISRIESAWRGCHECPLSGSRQGVVGFKGNPEAKIMLVVDPPDMGDDFAAMPMTGKAGRILEECLIAANIPPADVFVASIVGCRTPMDRPPKHDETVTCHPRLARAIEVVAPRVVIALGLVPARRVAGVGAVGPWRGKPMSGLEGSFGMDYRVIVSHSPRTLVSVGGGAPKMKREMVSDMKVARAMLREV